MQRKVLDFLYNQGELTFFATPQEEPDFEALKKFALSLNESASFVLFDFSHKLNYNEKITLANLFEKNFNEEDFTFIKNNENCCIVFGGYTSVTSTEDAFRIFYHNLQQIKKHIPHVFAILPNDEPKTGNDFIFNIAKTIIIDGKNTEASAIYIEDSPILQKTNILWLLKDKPNKKLYPKCYKQIKKGYSYYKEIKKINWKTEPNKIANAYKLICKAEILKKNPLDGLPKLFVNLFILFLLIVISIPFLIPTKIEMDVSNMRDRFSERDKLSLAPSFEYTFDGKEPIQRIARYAIGRFNAVITNEKMLKQYIEETIEENGYNTRNWELNNQIYPPTGTIIKFSRPDNLTRSSADSIGAAWKYWTSIVSDSVAYITEFYYEKASASNRQHNGIDVASRQGARILAPFAAKAWTMKDERGGIIIGLVREKDVIIFMHCDKLLYLDGQEVMTGDPIATVGLTGHTTGPHAHIVTGEISKKGKKRIGNVRYNVIDPITWFYKYKPTLQK